MESSSSTTSTRAIVLRFQLVTFALMASQFMYVVLALAVSHHHAVGTVHDSPHRQLIIQIGFVIGIALVAASYLATRRPSSVLAEHMKRFFGGFVFVEIGTLIGLLLFFMFGTIMPLIILVIVAAGSIYAHYACIARRISDSADKLPPQ